MTFLIEVEPGRSGDQTPDVGNDFLEKRKANVQSGALMKLLKKYNDLLGPFLVTTNGPEQDTDCAVCLESQCTCCYSGGRIIGKKNSIRMLLHQRERCLFAQIQR